MDGWDRKIRSVNALMMHNFSILINTNRWVLFIERQRYELKMKKLQEKHQPNRERNPFKLIYKNRGKIEAVVAGGISYSIAAVVLGPLLLPFVTFFGVLIMYEEKEYYLRPNPNFIKLIKRRRSISTIIKDCIYG